MSSGRVGGISLGKEGPISHRNISILLGDFIIFIYSQLVELLCPVGIGHGGSLIFNSQMFIIHFDFN